MYIFVYIYIYLYICRHYRYLTCKTCFELLMNLQGRSDSLGLGMYGVGSSKGRVLRYTYLKTPKYLHSRM